jgi:hypothetical protein
VLSFYNGLFWGYLALSIGIAVRFGYIAATESAGLRKGRARLVAGLAFASFFIVSPLLWTLYESQLPVFEFDGFIRQVAIRSHSSRHFSANLTIATTTGGEAVVHVSDRSDAWRQGQHLMCATTATRAR